MKPCSQRHFRKSFFLALIIATSLFPLSSRPENLTLGEVAINVANSKKNPGELSKLVTFHSGENLQREEIEARLEKLRQLDVIANAGYELTPAADGKSDLTINLTESLIVRSISVRGNYPFLAKEIRRQMLLQPGRPFFSEQIAASSDQIKSFLEKNGFYDSQIDIRFRENSHENTVDLKVFITKGASYRFGTISVTGNQKEQTNHIVRRVRGHTRYSETRLKNDLRKIRNRYTKMGFVKARIEADPPQFDDKTKQVDLNLTIRENKKIILKYSGDRAGASIKKLNLAAGFNERRAYDRFSVESGKNKLLRFYKERGHIQATIDTELSKNDDAITIIYNLHPGPKTGLAKVKFNGNHLLSNRQLRKTIKPTESSWFERKPFREHQALVDATQLLTYYRERGFFDAEISPPDINLTNSNRKAKVSYSIVEGKPFLLNSVYFIGLKPSLGKDLLDASGLRTGKFFRQADIERAKTKIMVRLHELGYAYAKLEGTLTIDHDQNGVDAEFTVTTGDVIHIRNIAIKGNNVTRTRIVRRHLKIKPGDIYNEDNLLAAQANLRKLGIFSSVQMAALGTEDQARNVDVLATVTERPSVTLDVQGGFDNRDLAHGEFSFTKRNLFGLAKQINLRLIGGQTFNRAEFTFFSPRVFGASWNLSNQYFVQYEDQPNFNAESHGVSLSTLKPYGSHWTLGLRDQVTHTNVDEINSDVANLGNSLFDNTFHEFEATINLDLRDNYADPQKGALFVLQNEVNTDLSNLKNNFNTVKFSVSEHQHLFGPFTFNNSLRFGHTFKLTSNPRIPVNKLFFMGGADSLRGFSEDAVDPSGGTVMIINNAELHVKLADSIKLAGFFDMGALQNDINKLSLDDFRETAGVGLRYFTPIGPVRLDWGFILDRQAGDPWSRVSFSFGYFF